MQPEKLKGGAGKGRMTAPIALFVYNRVWHTRQTIEALKKNELAGESQLVIFSDGPKTSQDFVSVQEVRDAISDIKGFQSVRVVARKVNMGLASSIVDGVTQLCDAYGKVIVLEDDMVTSRYFLQFMNDGLDLYATDTRVASIHGYQYPVGDILPETFFLRGADCWGWATWGRAWQHFEPDGRVLLQQLKRQKLTGAFDLDGVYGFTRMLEDQVARRNDSWAIRWHASCFLRGMLTLYPGISLVNNIGNDASGTHCGDSNKFAVHLMEQPISVGGVGVEEDAAARKIIAEFLRPSLPARVRSFIRGVLSIFRRTT